VRLAGLEIPARAEFVSLARLVVSSIAGDRYDLSDDQLDNLKLAVSEACVMMIEEDGGEASGTTIDIECVGASRRLEVFVSGQTPPDGTMVSAVTAEQVEQLGIPLISSLVDEVVVEHDHKRNTVHMTVHCSRSEEL
jgi:serine/threonine-protein kinase RsbW